MNRAIFIGRTLYYGVFWLANSRINFDRNFTYCSHLSEEISTISNQGEIQ